MRSGLLNTAHGSWKYTIKHPAACKSLPAPTLPLPQPMHRYLLLLECLASLLQVQNGRLRVRSHLEETE